MVRMFTVLALLMLGCLTAPGAAQDAPVRSGFTLLLNTGVGFQRDQYFETTETGLAGLNLGIGGFLSPDLAVMFRVSGTNAQYGDTWQVSGTGGASLQYWVNDRFHVEGGVGAGFWQLGDADDSGLGLILGFGYSIWHNARHNLYIGAEYAPAFTDPDTIHNVGIVLGWQLL